METKNITTKCTVGREKLVHRDRHNSKLPVSNKQQIRINNTPKVTQRIQTTTINNNQSQILRNNLLKSQTMNKRMEI